MAEAPGKGEAKLFEIVSPEFGRCPFLQDFRSERQPVVLRFAEPPALSPWRFAPRGEGDRPNLKFRCRPSFRTNSIPEPEACRLPWFSSLFRLFGSFFEKKERLPQNLTYRINERLNKYSLDMPGSARADESAFIFIGPSLLEPLVRTERSDFPLLENV